MSAVENLRQSRKAARLHDPHGWAERMENEVSARSVIGGIALVVSIILAVNTWLMWQQIDDLKDRLSAVESVSDLPPPGFVVVN